MLNRLEHDRLFITALDERHELFRYHNLFVDFLRNIHAESIGPRSQRCINGQRCGLNRTETWRKLFNMRWLLVITNGPQT